MHAPSFDFGSGRTHQAPVVGGGGWMLGFLRQPNLPLLGKHAKNSQQRTANLHDDNHPGRATSTATAGPFNLATIAKTEGRAQIVITG